MKYLILLFIPFWLPAQGVTLEYLEKQPKSISKDFYIWMFLDQDISAKEADAAFKQVRRENSKLLYRYAEKTDDPKVKRKVECMKMPGKEVVKEDAECIYQGLSLSTATRLSKKQLQQAIKTIKKTYPRKAKELGIFASKDPFTSLIHSDGDTFVSVFNGAGYKYRIKHFNHKLPKELLRKVESKESFSQTVKLIVTNPEYDKLQSSLFHVDPSRPKHKAAFFLAMNAINHYQPVLANKYLDRAYERAISQFHKDKVKFWKFQVTHEEKYIKEVFDSPDVNIYSLFAAEYFGKEPPQNIITDLITENKLGGHPISDPFFWVNLERETKKVQESEKKKYVTQYGFADTEPHLALILQRISRFKEHYFVKPYTKYLKPYDAKRKALILSISRQESYFIPSAISTSYALGMMQIMPFNVEAIMKAKHEKIPLTDMFIPAKNIEYADYLLKSLVKQFKHPLFVAYAYNGGGGFCKRMLKQKGFFEKDGYYEPYLSMEMVDYDESRHYGKKVLANYYIYRKSLGIPVTMKELFESAVNPL